MLNLAVAEKTMNFFTLLYFILILLTYAKHLPTKSARTLVARQLAVLIMAKQKPAVTSRLLGRMAPHARQTKALRFRLLRLPVSRLVNYLQSLVTANPQDASRKGMRHLCLDEGFYE